MDLRMSIKKTDEMLPFICEWEQFIDSSTRAFFATVQSVTICHRLNYLYWRRVRDLNSNGR